MCLYLKSSCPLKEEKVALEDIPVIKGLRWVCMPRKYFKDIAFSVRTPQMGTMIGNAELLPLQFNPEKSVAKLVKAKIVGATLESSKIKVTKVTSKLHRVTEGIHSFSINSDDGYLATHLPIESISAGTIITKALIPKGTKYYEGMFGELVSERLVIDSVIRINTHFSSFVKDKLKAILATEQNN